MEITHYGRVSSRLNVAYSEPNVTIGYATFLRVAGTKPSHLFLYKLVVTCDMPVHLVVKALQLVWRRVRGQHDKADKTALALRGLWAFSRSGIGRFWRA